MLPLYNFKFATVAFTKLGLIVTPTSTGVTTALSLTMKVFNAITGIDFFTMKKFSGVFAREQHTKNSFKKSFTFFVKLEKLRPCKSSNETRTSEERL